MVHNLGKENSIFNQFVMELRDAAIQTDSMRFRRNLERIGEVFAYEISKKMDYKALEVTTPLGLSTIPVLKQQPVIATILRAGLPLHQGFINFFDKADSAFVSAFRKHHKDGSFDIHVDYVSAGNLTGRTLIISDPMLATGSSMLHTYKALLKKGMPEHVHIVAVIASSEGVNYIQNHIPGNYTLWVGAVDDELTAQAFIVPGLGDAGDLAYGKKV
jgi:uracil phosphoribosyltransferase